MLQQIIKWAESEKGIRSVILVGSRARDEPSDPLSDYDLAIFAEDTLLYTNDNRWISKIGTVWVCVNEKVDEDHQEFQTRLVIFEGGIKVDFAFFPLDRLPNLVTRTQLPPEYDMGYTILIDKDEIAKKIPKPTFKAFDKRKPTEAEFFRIINEFWFEAYHVAIYLKRMDLWSVQARASGLHNHFLLKMIEWHECAQHGWKYRIPPKGKRMHTWVDRQTWDALNQVFAHFNFQDSRRALLNTIELFGALSVETSEKLGFKYPQELEDRFSKFILEL